MSETDLTRKIQVSVTDADTRIFRNNVGTAWQGRITHNRDGSITIYNPRPVHFGLCEGSSDLIGLRSVEVTPAMIGQRVAVFVALEIKTSATARRTDEQINFVAMVNALGGRAGFASSVDEARNILQRVISADTTSVRLDQTA